MYVHSKSVHTSLTLLLLSVKLKQCKVLLQASSVGRHVDVSNVEHSGALTRNQEEVATLNATKVTLVLISSCNSIWIACNV